MRYVFKRVYFISFIFIVLFGHVAFGHQPSNPLLQKFDSIVSKTEQICNTQGKDAQAAVAQLCAIANQHPELPILLSKCFYIEAYVDYALGENDSTFYTRIQTVLTAFNDKNKYSDEQNLLNYALAMYYANTGNYAKAFSFTLGVLEELKKSNDSLMIAGAFNLLGRICYNIRSYKMADEYYSKAMQYAIPNKRAYNDIKVNTFSIKRFFSSNLEFTDSLINMLPAIKASKDFGLLIKTYVNIFGNYVASNQLIEARKYIDTLQPFFPSIDNPKFTSSIYNNIGGYFLVQKNYKDASDYLRKAKDITNRSNNGEIHSYVLFNLSFLYEKIGKIDSAYAYLKQYNALTNQLYNNSKTIEAYSEYIAIYQESSKNKLTIVEQELILKNRLFLILIISATAIVLIFLLFVAYIQQKKKQKNKELEERLKQEMLIQQLQEEKNKELEERLKQEMLILQLEEEKNKLQKKMLDTKERKMTSYSLQLAKKNELLEQIMDLSKNVSSDKKISKEIKHLLAGNLNRSKDDWNDFLVHFNEVDPDFFDKLKNLCNELTENNLRMCAYFRLGMTAKQIAQILNITPRAIVMHRHRLRKKLELENEADIYDFLRNI